MAEAPSIGNDLVVLVKEMEGFSARAYLCPAGYPTQGFGHRVPNMAALPIDEHQAEQILLADLREAQGKALTLAPNLITHPHALDALTDLIFNIGAEAVRGSSTVKFLLAEDWASAALRFRTWDKAHVNGAVVALPGLTRRRARGAAWIMAELGTPGQFDDVQGGAS